MSGWMWGVFRNLACGLLIGAGAFVLLVLLMEWAVEDDVRKVEEGRKDWRTMMVLPVPVGRQGAFGEGVYLSDEEVISYEYKQK